MVLVMAVMTVSLNKVSAEESETETSVSFSEEKESNLTENESLESSESSKSAVPFSERYAIIIYSNLSTIDQNEVSKAVSLYQRLIYKGWYQTNIEFLGPDQITSTSGIANLSNVENAFNNIIENSIGSKEIMIYISDHIYDTNSETILFFTDGNISSTVISCWLENMTYSKLTFIMNGVHSGLAGPEFCGALRDIICSMSSTATFSPDQFNITRGLSNPKADTNKDGEVSFVEAYYSERSYLRRISNQVPELW
jgi:hypothetical protein